MATTTVQRPKLEEKAKEHVFLAPEEWRRGIDQPAISLFGGHYGRLKILYFGEGVKFSDGIGSPMVADHCFSIETADVPRDNRPSVSIFLDRRLEGGASESWSSYHITMVNVLARGESERDEDRRIIIQAHVPAELFKGDLPPLQILYYALDRLRRDRIRAINGDASLSRHSSTGKELEVLDQLALIADYALGAAQTGLKEHLR